MHTSVVTIKLRGDDMVKNLRKFRLEKNVSQQQLADVIGTTQQSINKYENHSTEPDIETLIKLADYFEISVDQLVGHSVPGSKIPRHKLNLTREEILLVESYRRLSKSERESIHLVIKNYLKAI